MQSRRAFITTSGSIAAGFALGCANSKVSASDVNVSKVPLYAHLWVYASRYPPDWDCTPILDDAFSDLKYAGFQGVELMEIILRHGDAVARLKELSQKHSLPVVGTSYNADMWNRQEHEK